MNSTRADLQAFLDETPSVLASPAVERLWRHAERGLDLRSPADGDPRLHSTLRQVQRALAVRGRDEPEAFRALLERVSRDLEARLIELSERQIDPSGTLDGVLEIGERLRWVRDLAPSAGEAGPAGALGDALGELDWVERELQRAEADLGRGASAEERSSIERAADAVYRGRCLALAARARGFLAGSEATAGSSVLDPVWQALLVATELAAAASTALARHELGGARPGAPAEALVPLARPLEERRDALRRRVGELAAELTPPESRAFHSSLSEEYAERSGEALSGAEDLDVAVAVRALRAARDDVVWALGRLDAAFPAARRRKDPMSGARRRLVSVRERLTNEIQEKGLAADLSRVLGRRVASAIDGGIVALIFLVIVMLGVETALPKALLAAWKWPLIWIDTVVCGAFLAEFGLKIAFAREGRLRYLRRHALIDLLPSLPFTLGTELLTARAATGPSAAGQVKAVRVVRLARLARFLRAMRPLIRMARLFLFFLRGLDRLVKKFSRIFNRGIVFFDPPAEDREEIAQPTPRERLVHLQGTYLRTSRRLSGEIASLERVRRLERRAGELSGWFAAFDDADASHGGGGGAPAAELRVEQLIMASKALDAAGVEEALGRPFAERLAGYFRYFNVPVVRRLPLVREVVVPPDRWDPLEVAARACRQAGALLARVVDRFHAAGDLNGIVSGPQMVARIGNTLINSTQKSAKRLLSLGASFLVLKLLVGAFFRIPEAPAIPAEAAHAPMLREVAVMSDELAAGVRDGRIATKGPGRDSRFERIDADLDVLLADWREYPWEVYHPGFPVEGHPEPPAEVHAAHLLDLRMRTITGESDPLGATMRKVTGNLQRLLGVPLIALGAVAFAIMLFGIWLKRIAGEATGVYEKIAEAQFQNLMDRWTGPRCREREVSALLDRVLAPEAAATGAAALADAAGVERLLSRGLEEPDVLRRAVESGVPRGVAVERRSALEQIVALYQDYLTGVPLHRSDTKLTEQLLGNVAIQRVLHERLRLDAKTLAQLKKLDLTPSGRSPNPWFHLICLALTERAAKLVLEYNRYALPLERLPRAGAEARSEYDRWLRGNGAPAAEARERKAKNAARTSFADFRNAEFDVLHFLTNDPGRDEAVRERFGEDVLAKLRSDRRRMIRQIFGTYPFHGLPRADRTVNFYDLYVQRVAEGRVFVLPIVLARWTGRALAVTLRAFYRTIRDIIRPGLGSGPAVEGYATYEVAVRKLNRMRKTVYVTLMELRARFDPEYVQARVPCGAVFEGPDFRGDLDFIGALDEERARFEEFRRDRQELARAFRRRLDELGLSDPAALDRFLGEADPSLPGRRAEVLRAWSIAFAIDHRDLRSLLEAEDSIRATGDQAIRQRGVFEGYGLAGGVVRGLWIAARLVARRGRNPERRRFDAWRARSPWASAVNPELRWLRRAYRLDVGGIQRAVRLVEGGARGDARAAALERLREVALDVGEWTRQLLVLRTLQSLAVLNLEKSRRVVAELGEFEQVAEPPRAT